MALRERQMLPGEPGPPTEPEPRAMPLTPISYALVGVCVVVFLGQLVSGGEVTLRLMLSGPEVAKGEWWRVLTCDLVHGNLLHIFFNLSAVWTLGRILEAAIGPFRFAITTLVGALGSAFAVLVVNFDQPTLGISGVILAWAGAMLPIATKAGRRQLGMWLVQVLVISLLPNVSWAGHLGGFVFGVPCGWVMRRGPKVFGTLAPLLVFAAAVLVFLAGTGRLALGAR